MTTLPVQRYSGFSVSDRSRFIDPKHGRARRCRPCRFAPFAETRLFNPSTLSGFARRCAVLALLIGCTPALPTIGDTAPTSPAPNQAFKPDDSANEAIRAEGMSAPHSAFASGKEVPKEVLTLPKAVDFSLRNNPRTRAAWLRARASAAQIGKDKSAYYPEVNLGGSISYAHQTQVGGRYSFNLGTVGPYINLSYLLFDFGARVSKVDADIAALIEANFMQTDAIQNQIMAVAQAYYRYESAKALVDSAQANLASAQLSYEVATTRHQAGTVDLGDVLQAETALLTAKLAVKSARGQAETLKGALASELGLRADGTFEIVPLPEHIDIGNSLEEVSKVLDRAIETRPDLLAAKASAAAAWQRAEAAKQQALPTLTLNAAASRSYYIPEQSSAFGDNYGATLTFNYPLFTGFSSSYEERRAGFEALAKEADADALQRQIAAQVWNAYQQMRTSGEQLDEVRELLETSKRLEEFSRGRYDAGVGTILDLMSAQATLASARSRYVQARADFLLSMVQLSHDVGELNVDTVLPLKTKTHGSEVKTNLSPGTTSTKTIGASPGQRSSDGSAARSIPGVE